MRGKIVGRKYHISSLARKNNAVNSDEKCITFYVYLTYKNLTKGLRIVIPIW